MSIANRVKSVITNYVYPPIPPRQFDWCAYRDGDEECGPVGWGATKEAAITDLLTMEADGVDEEG